MLLLAKFIQSQFQFRRSSNRIFEKCWRMDLSTFFGFPEGIRKIIYTTTLIKNVNRGIRKYTKARSILPNDQAVEKVVYLSLMQAQKNGPCPKGNGPICYYNLLTVLVRKDAIFKSKNDSLHS
ncbi:transposase [[Flexibacter] sp. ATCC 35208]|uniref:transposase n=1 Tax=[Flexibacter] sp. ATCC 35208 TaxID=1936242 RepID=UPI0009CEDAA2|nr:hypothetical protein BW716_30030 [[Flexibacter] sp. ATCC 35208]